MNTLQILKFKNKHEDNISINPLIVSANNSRVMKRKVPQTRLSYLKKLFSRNMNIHDEAGEDQCRIVHEQTKAFDKSRIIAHSNKNIEKFNLREVPESIKSSNQSLQIRKSGILKNRINNETQILPQNKLLNGIFNQKASINNSFYTFQQHCHFPKNKISRRRNQKSRSETIRNHQFSVDHTNRLSKQTRYTREKIANHSLIETKNDRIAKKQIKELKKLNRLLQDIKCEILKNRSMIIEGMKQIKQIGEKSQHKDSISQTIIGLQEAKLNSKSSLKAKFKESNPQRSSIHGSLTPMGPKPKIQYLKFYKIR